MADKKSIVDIFFRTSTKGLKEAQNEMRKTQKSEKDLQKDTKQTAKEFENSGARVAASTGKTDKRFKKTAATAKKTNKEIRSLGGGFKSLLAEMSPLKKVGAGAVISAIGLAAVSSVKKFADFEQAISNLSAITGATGKDLDFFSETARKLGAATTLSATQVADAFRIVASAKPDLLESKEALAAVTTEAITLAEAAGITVPEAANTMASALNQFGVEADQAARFTNVLAAGSKFGAASIAEIGEALRESGTAAASMGLDFEETNAALQLLSTNAIKGGSAGTQLRGVLLALETKTEEFRPSVLGVSEALRQYGAAGFDTGEQLKTFGRLNLTAGQILTSNADKFDKLKESVTGTNVAQEQAATRTDNLNGAWSRFKSAIEELQLVLTSDTGIGAALTVVVDVLTFLVNTISFAVGGLVELTKFFWELHPVVNLVKDLFKEFSPEIKSMSIGMEEFGIIIGGAVIEAFSYLAQTAETVFEVIANAINIAKNKLIDFVTAILDFAQGGASIFDKVFGTGAASSVDKLSSSFKAAKVEVKTTGEVVSSVSGKYKKIRKDMRDSTEQSLELAASQKELAKETEATEEATKLLAAAQQEAERIAAEKAETIKEVKDALQEEIDALKRTNEEQEIYVALKEAGITANDAEAEGIINLVKELEAEKLKLEEVKQAKKDAATAAKDLEKAAVKAAKETAKEWQETRNVLSDFFFEFAKEGLNAFDTLLEGFKSMATKMVAEAAASGIMNLFGVGNIANGTGGGFFGNSGGGAVMGAIGNYGKQLFTDYTSGNLSAGSFVPAGLKSAGSAINNAYMGYQGFSQTGGSGLQGAWQGLTSTGEYSSGFVGPTRGEMVGAQGVDWTSLGLSMLASFAGAYAGREVFDNEGSTGIGAGVGGVVGGVVGSMFPVVGTTIGAGIGAFLGEGFEKVLGDVFGFGGKPSHNRVYSDLDFSKTEQDDPFFKDKGSHRKQMSAAEAVADSLSGLANILGGSDYQASFSVSARNGFEYYNEAGDRIESEKPDKIFNEFVPKIIQSAENLSGSFKTLFENFEGGGIELAKYAGAVVGTLGPTAELSENTLKLAKEFAGTTEELAAYTVTLGFVDSMISETESLTPILTDLIYSFRGTNEEILAFSGFVVQLSDMITNNPIETAIQDFDEALSIASQGVVYSYNQTVDALLDSLDTFDLSVESIGLLTNNLAATQEAAYQLALGITVLKTSLGEMFASSAKSIREQLMSEQELTKARLEERDALFESIDTLVNPDEIRAAAEQINNLNNQIFAGLTDEEKIAYGEEFAQFAEMAAEKTTAQLDKTLELVRDSQQALMDQVGTTLNLAADRYNDAALTMTEAARTMLEAAARLPQNIVVNVESSQVTG